MATRRVFQRAFLTAAFSTASALTATAANGVDSSANAGNSGIQRVQYQTGQQGQPVPNPNSAVSQELRRMFAENGQPMPSMNPNQLPNANVHRPAGINSQPGNSPTGNPQGQPRMAVQNPGQPAGQAAGQPTNRPSHLQPAPTTRAQTASPNQTPAKKNFLQKFVGKVTGRDRKEAEAAVVPPVPPGYQEPAPAPPADMMAGTQQNPGSRQNQNPGSPTMQGQRPQQQAQMRPGMQPGQNAGSMNRPNPASSASAQQHMAQQHAGQQLNAGQRNSGTSGNTPSVAGSRNSPQVRNGQPVTGGPPSQFSAGQSMAARPASNPQRPQTGLSRPTGNRAGMPIPPGTGVVQMRSGKTGAVKQPQQTIPPVPAVPPVVDTEDIVTDSGLRDQFIQPGSAPAFMPQETIPEATGAPGAEVPAASPVQPAIAAAAKVPVSATPDDDGFVDPFSDSESALDSDSLDLDALALPPVDSQPAATSEVVREAVASVPEPSVAAPGSAAPAGTAASNAAASNSTAANDGQALPFVEDGAEDGSPAGAGTAESPFTGVQLSETDAEMFQATPSATISAKAPFDDPAEESGEAFGEPAPPMEDFANNLPAISLPAVDEVAPVPGVSADNSSTADLAVSPLEANPTQAGVTTGTTTASPSPLSPVDSSIAQKTERPARESVEDVRQHQAAEQDQRRSQLEKIQARNGQAGFKGFCPVALRDRRQLVDADPQITATFGLQTYAFSSAAAKADFEADPSRYAPAAGGNDVVVLVNTGEEQPGMLDYALWYRDRLYLFRSRETMAIFNANPLQFANQY